MLRIPLAAVLFLAVSASVARAQYTGPLPNSGSGFDDRQFYWNVLPSGERFESEADREQERRYQETLRTRIPNRKPSNDPWAGVRQTPRAAPPDRHRPQ
jgi:hypothetical protein